MENTPQHKTMIRRLKERFGLATSKQPSLSQKAQIGWQDRQEQFVISEKRVIKELDDLLTSLVPDQQRASTMLASFIDMVRPKGSLMRTMPHPALYSGPENIFDVTFPGGTDRLTAFKDRLSFVLLLRAVEAKTMLVKWTQEVLQRFGGVNEIEKSERMAKQVFVNAFTTSYFRAVGGTTFQTTRALDKLLDDVDVTDIPVEHFRLPFPEIYIRYSSSPEKGDTETTGVYLFERQNAYGRSICIFPTGQPTYSPVAVINGFEMAFAAEDEHVGVLESVNSNIPPEADSAELNFRREAARLVKVLLYINSVERRGDTETPTWSRTRPVPESVRRSYKGTSLRPILIGPDKYQTPDAITGNSRVMPTHWRRGHFRHVRFGEGRRESKLVFIAPVLVNADLATHHTARKQYQVGKKQ